MLFQKLKNNSNHNWTKKRPNKCHPQDRTKRIEEIMETISVFDNYTSMLKWPMYRCVCVCTHDWSRKVCPQEYQLTAEEHRCPAKAQSSYNLYHNKSQTSLLDMIQHMNRPWEKPWEIRTVNEWTTAFTFSRKRFTWSTRPVGLFRLDSWWMNRWSVHWKKRRSKRWVFNSKNILQFGFWISYCRKNMNRLIKQTNNEKAVFYFCTWR